MTFLSGQLSRRTFLSGAGASLAATVAQAAAKPLLPPPPIRVQVLLDDQQSLQFLGSVLTHHDFDVRTIITRSFDLVAPLDRLLEKRKLSPLHFALDADAPHSISAGLPMLVFGNWINKDRQLIPLLRQRVTAYLDDPDLSHRIAARAASRLLAERSLVGLYSPLDPVAEFAVQRVHSGGMGPVVDIVTNIDPRDATNAWEAAAIQRRLVREQKHIRFRTVAARKAVSAVTVTCSRGIISIPLYSVREREESLTIRLSHFASVARGEHESALTIENIADVSLRRAMLYTSRLGS